MNLLNDNQHNKPDTQKAFTLIELVVVIGVAGILVGLLLPALAKSKNAVLRSACLSNLRQQSVAWFLYLDENSERFPDRRDLKSALPGGYRPWSNWPASDPRAGWSGIVLTSYLTATTVFLCPSAKKKNFDSIPQVAQNIASGGGGIISTYWMWRFDRTNTPVPLDNFWGKNPAECIADLRIANTPNAPPPSSASEVELIVDVYFPSTIASLPENLRGRSAHAGGRNRVMLDGSVGFYKDKRTMNE
ncbi:MAG: prepilin-type N-terminal cleavage/methylation domain-containing protein [Verrucomicrobiae bacterium]|nr:prepilin-type N-terminal cleavage/methylation domain-containing protein [Verrucomicrobiae bacterium]